MHHNKQRYSDSYCKSTSFSRFTSYSYNSTVLFYHCLYVEKPQPVAFGIVDISCRNPVEFIENVRLFIRRDTNTVVCNRDFHLFRFLFQIGRASCRERV